jgi:hypothetical protein
MLDVRAHRSGHTASMTIELFEHAVANLQAVPARCADASLNNRPSQLPSDGCCKNRVQ